MMRPLIIVRTVEADMRISAAVLARIAEMNSRRSLVRDWTITAMADTGNTHLRRVHVCDYA